jgi:hypothetical protein
MIQTAHHNLAMKLLLLLQSTSSSDKIHNLSIRKGNIINISIIIAFAISFTVYMLFIQIVSAISPSFIRQEIKDRASDWIQLSTGNKTIGSDNIDIQSVTYSSNGHFLNATLWLSSFYKEPDTANKVRYGVFIDADFNNDSGFQGIDYIGQVEWNKMTNEWKYSVNELASNRQERPLEITDDRATSYSERGSYISFSVDLRDALLPPRYRVFFFAYSQQNDGSSILDAVRWAYIPPPEFIISTSPRVVNITAGEKETIEVELNSTTGLNPFVHFNTNNGHSGMHLGFEYPDRQVPSYGIATTPMVISITNNVSVGPQTVSILGNLTFPTQTFDSPIKNTKKGVIKIESEHVMTQTTFTVNIQNPLTPQQQLKIWLDEWFNPLTGTWTAIAAIISGILGWRTWNTHRSKDGGETSQKSTTITYSNVRPHK